MPLNAEIPLLPTPRTLPAAVSTVGDPVAIETSLAIALPPTSSRRRPGPTFQPSDRCRNRYRPKFILRLAKGKDRWLVQQANSDDKRIYSRRSRFLRRCTAGASTH